MILAVVFAVLIFLNYINKPFDKTNNEYTTVTIEEGADLDAAAKTLKKAGIIGSTSNFTLTSRLKLQTDIKPGTYYLSPAMDATSIAKALCKGNVTLNGFIVPEGFTMEQIFTSLSRDGLGDRDAFMSAAEDPFLQELDFIGKDVDGADQVEGFLMPGTYRLDAEADEAMIVMTMLDSFSNFFNEDYRARTDELGLTVRELIVIASMIENDTIVDSEKPKLASVIYNRINLEMDEDVPKVPLCSPGEASIMAALYPEDNEDTYYILSDKLDGTHVFTSDEEEYEELKAAYEEALAERYEKLRSREEDVDEEEASEEGEIPEED